MVLGMHLPRSGEMVLLSHGAMNGLEGIVIWCKISSQTFKVFVVLEVHSLHLREMDMSLLGVPLVSVVTATRCKISFVPLNRSTQVGVRSQLFETMASWSLGDLDAVVVTNKMVMQLLSNTSDMPKPC